MRIGIVGGGQLGRMIALSGLDLGHAFVVLEPAEEVPAAIAAEVIPAAYTDPAALAELASRVDVVTCEFESVPSIALSTLAASVPVRPGVSAFHTASDRLLEKTLFRTLGIGTAPFEKGAPPVVRKIPIAATQLGDADMVELRLVVDKTFVPALEAGSASGDSRELGARVFHAFVQ